MGSEDLRGWLLWKEEGETRESSRGAVTAGGSINWCSQCERKLDVLTKRNGITI